MAALQTNKLPAGSGNYLAGVTTEAPPRPSASVIYGPPGVGKTSIGASFPSALFLVDGGELGVDTLKRGGQIHDVPVLPPAKHWHDVLGTIRELIESEHDYKTLVVDTIGGMERLCHEFVCARDFKGDWGDQGFASYNKGYEVALPEWHIFLAALDELRDKRGMGILLLAHSHTKPHKNPEGEDFDRILPAVHHKTWAKTHKWADLVGYYRYYVVTEKSSSGAKAKGKGGKARELVVEYSAAFDAKNRHGLPASINMGASGAESFQKLSEAIKAARVVKKG